MGFLFDVSIDQWGDETPPPPPHPTARTYHLSISVGFVNLWKFSGARQRGRSETPWVFAPRLDGKRPPRPPVFYFSSYLGVAGERRPFPRRRHGVPPSSGGGPLIWNPGSEICRRETSGLSFGFLTPPPAFKGTPARDLLASMSRSN
ncbi:hypothetical protein NL676_022844 [Syzygium grande]|nr:hypothetical protein NL676_022844 [Syzygium grande]